MSALSLSLFLTVLAPADQAQTATDFKPVIEKAIQAYGGEQKLLALKAAREKSKGTVQIMGMDVAFVGHSTYQYPAQMRQELNLDIQGMKFNVLQVFNNGKGWTRAFGEIKALEGDELDDMKEEAYYSKVNLLVPLLKEPEFKLKLIGEDKVGDKPVVGVKVVSKGHKDIDLYFDKTTGLIIKTVRMGRDSATMKEAKWETFYSDFKETNGVKYGAKVKILQDGGNFIEAEITGLELLEKVDEKEFGKPGKDA